MKVLIDTNIWVSSTALAVNADAIAGDDLDLLILTTFSDSDGSASGETNHYLWLGASTTGGNDYPVDNSPKTWQTEASTKSLGGLPKSLEPSKFNTFSLFL